MKLFKNVILFSFILFLSNKTICQTIDSTLILDANVGFVSKKNKTTYQKCRLEAHNQYICIKSLDLDTIILKLEMSKIKSAGYGMFKTNTLVIKYELNKKILVEIDSKIKRKNLTKILKKNENIAYKDLRALGYTFYGFDVALTGLICVFLVLN